MIEVRGGMATCTSSIILWKPPTGKITMFQVSVFKSSGAFCQLIIIPTKILDYTVQFLSMGTFAPIHHNQEIYRDCLIPGGKINVHINTRQK